VTVKKNAGILSGTEKFVGVQLNPTYLYVVIKYPV
jgi:hypothetical protein